MIPIFPILTAVKGVVDIVKTIKGDTSHEKHENVKKIFTEQIKKANIEPKESVINFMIELGVLINNYGGKFEVDGKKIIIDLE